jgi:hypothetical protein
LVAPVPSLYELAGHCTPPHRENTSHVGVASSVVYYEETKRGLKRILSFECRCNERLKAKAGGSTRLSYTCSRHSMFSAMSMFSDMAFFFSKFFFLQNIGPTKRTCTMRPTKGACKSTCTDAAMFPQTSMSRRLEARQGGSIFEHESASSCRAAKKVLAMMLAAAVFPQLSEGLLHPLPALLVHSRAPVLRQLRQHSLMHDGRLLPQQHTLARVYLRGPSHMLSHGKKSISACAATGSSIGNSLDPLAHSFSSLGLDPWLVEAADKQDWHTPTDIQCRLIPPLLAGVNAQITNHYNLIYDTYAEYNSANITTRFGEQFDTGKDVWAEAPTGSGKTGATYCFPQCFK